MANKKFIKDGLILPVKVYDTILSHLNQSATCIAIEKNALAVGVLAKRFSVTVLLRRGCENFGLRMNKECSI